MCALQAIRKGLRRLQNSGFGRKKFWKNFNFEGKKERGREKGEKA